ncbi:MAG: ribosome biogenesis GTPase Der [Chlamydiia bacterium]|nr:ribosome biogenesis GTPase Der [Chlamydiia bacterium]
MSTPKIAIVGRPNVGKSALFNRIVKKRIAIVDEQEGVTRDRLYATSELFGFPFVVIDTGGIDPHSTDQFAEAIRRQAELAIEEADRIVMVVDGRMGVTTLDKELAKYLLKKKCHVTLAVNKIDDLRQEEWMAPFYSLGFEKMIGVSAMHGLKVVELLDSVLKDFSRKESIIPDSRLRISVVGRPNVGKSTLLNALLNDERCVVSDIPGTTRDHVEVPLSIKGEDYILIDTAGIRRKKSEKETVDKFAFIRTEEAIDQSDLCLLMINANEGLTHEEKKIANLIEKKGGSCIILINKWDLVKKCRMEHSQKEISSANPFLAHCPILCISAKEGRNLGLIFDTVKQVLQERRKRITTGALNSFLERTMQLYHPPAIRGKRLRIYYLTQIKETPPTFVLFINHSFLIEGGYKRYLINQFRKAFGFRGTPLQFYFRNKQSKKASSSTQ